MDLPKTIVRTAVAVATVACFTIAAPVAQAAPRTPEATGSGATTASDLGVTEAPMGKQCGAYGHKYNDTGGITLRYYHCGGTSVKVEVDMRHKANEFTCVYAWSDVPLAGWTSADNAWYVGPCDR